MICITDGLLAAAMCKKFRHFWILEQTQQLETGGEFGAPQPAPLPGQPHGVLYRLPARGLNLRDLTRWEHTSRFGSGRARIPPDDLC
jgi:hypothetical protein